jgi:hypothetical protein
MTVIEKERNDRHRNGEENENQRKKWRNESVMYVNENIIRL